MLSGEGFVAACNMMIFCILCWADLLSDVEICLRAKEERPGDFLGSTSFFDIDSLVQILNDLRREKAKELAGYGISQESDDTAAETASESEDDSSSGNAIPASEGPAPTRGQVSDSLETHRLTHTFSAVHELLRSIGTLLSSRASKAIREISAAFLACLIQNFPNYHENPGSLPSPEQQSSAFQSRLLSELSEFRAALRPLRPLEHLELLEDVCRRCQQSRSPTLAALLSQELCMHAAASAPLSRVILNRLQTELFLTLPVLSPEEREVLCARIGQALLLACNPQTDRRMGSLIPLITEDDESRALLLACAEEAGVEGEVAELLQLG